MLLRSGRNKLYSLTMDDLNVTDLVGDDLTLPDDSFKKNINADGSPKLKPDDVASRIADDAVHRFVSHDAVTDDIYDFLDENPIDEIGGNVSLIWTGMCRRWKHCALNIGPFIRNSRDCCL